MGKRFIAIIPARGGSKGIPRKNIKNLNGKPLIAWTIDAALRSKYIDRTVVSTDDEEIMNYSTEFGAEVPFLRPHYLAKDDSSSVDVILDALFRLQENEGFEFDYLLLLQPTSPLRNESHIDDAIECFAKSCENYDSLVSITELDHPIFWNRVINKENKLENFLEYDKNKCFRRQEFSNVYRMNGAIYLISIERFLEIKQFETESTMPYIMKRMESIDIDTEDDLKLAEYYLTQD